MIDREAPGLRRGDARRGAASTRRSASSRAASPGIAERDADRQLPRLARRRSTSSSPCSRRRSSTWCARCAATRAMAHATEPARRAATTSGAPTASGSRCAGVTLRAAAPGATLAVFGANGAGKTTLLRILATLLRPHARRGARARRASCRARAGRCAGGSACSRHEPLLYRDLTARENLRFHARLHGVARGARRGAARRGRARARAPTSRCARSRAGWCSASAVCRAVLHEPELLLLDEPLANLDPARRRAGRAADRARGGPARVLISHDVEARAGRGRPRARPARGRRRAAGAPARRGRRRPTCGGCTGEARGRRADLRKDLLARAAHARVGAGDGAVQRLDVRALPLRARPRRASSGDLAAGVLWVTLLFAAVLGINRLFVAEREQGGFDGFLLAPVDRTALFVAKATVLFVLPRRASRWSRCRRSRSCCSARRRGRRCRGCSPCSRSPTSALAVVGDAGRRARRPDPRARPDRAAAGAAAARSRCVIAAARATSPLLAAGGARAARGALAGCPRPSMIWSSGCSPTRSSTSCWRTDQPVFGRGLQALSHRSPSSLIIGAFALVFFYAPNDADQGFIQKIFYLHVPLAIVALCGFVAGGDLRRSATCARGDRAHDLRSYVAIHLSLILGRRRAGHRLDLGAARRGATGGCGTSRRSSSFLIVFLLYACYQPLRFSIEDPRAPGALRGGVRDRRRRVRAAELHRRAAGRSRSRTRACSSTTGGAMPGAMRADVPRLAARRWRACS